AHRALHPFPTRRSSDLRYPRGSGPGAEIVKEMNPLPLGKGVVRRRGPGGEGCVAILAFGSLLKPALEAGADLDATVVDMRFVKRSEKHTSELHSRSDLV